MREHSIQYMFRSLLLPKSQCMKRSPRKYSKDLQVCIVLFNCPLLLLVVYVAQKGRPKNGYIAEEESRSQLPINLLPRTSFLPIPNRTLQNLTDKSTAFAFFFSSFLAYTVALHLSAVLMIRNYNIYFCDINTKIIEEKPHWSNWMEQF